VSVEEGGREGEGGGADTELKTKTPHVNVGKNKNIHIPECSILFPQYSEASKSLPFLPRFPAYIGCLQLLDSQ